MEKLLTYLKGVKTEWGKITWPDKKQVFVQTIVVIVVVAVFTTIIFGLDILYKGTLCGTILKNKSEYSSFCKGNQQY